MIPHRCHAEGCDVPVPERMFACHRHWFALPKSLRDQVWQAYREGQEIDKKPSDAYMVAHHEAVAWLAEHEGRHAEAERHRDKALSYCLALATSNGRP